MADKDPFDISKRMSDQRTEDTGPELELRRRLHARGLRYRVHRAVLEGSRRKHDIVFVGPRVVVDVHGCFWHGCPDHFVAPKANAGFWAEKIATNRRRDDDTSQRLEAEGWTHMVVWEHEDPNDVSDRIAAMIRARQESVTPP